MRAYTNTQLEADKKEYQRKYREHPENRERRREYRKEYNQRPEVKERHREYMNEYNQRPEVKKRIEEYNQRPEVKEHRREYERHPERKKYQREYNQRPEVKKHRQEYYQKNEGKGHYMVKKERSKGEKCSVDGCPYTARCRGMCTKHYNRMIEKRNIKNGKKERKTEKEKNKAYTNTQLEADKRKVTMLNITEKRKEAKRRMLMWLYVKQPQGDMKQYRKGTIEVK